MNLKEKINIFISNPELFNIIQYWGSNAGTFFESHNPHGVQGVDERQAQAEPLSERLGNGLQLVVTPGVALISFPRVSEGITYRL